MNCALPTITILLLVLSTFVVVAIPVNAESEETFLIGFNGELNEKLIRQHGGKIVITHSNANVVIARFTPRERESLITHDAIAYVEKDVAIQIASQTVPQGIDAVNADLVHSNYKGSGVNIAVIDTGIDYLHPDLDGNYMGGYDFVNRNSSPMDDHGHGTHVAGTIAAEDNDLGVIGVAPEANLYCLKVIDADGYGVASHLIAAIEWAVNNDMDIISISIGTNYATSSLEDACDAAVDAGVILIASTGNGGTSDGSGDTVYYPARYDSVIAVGAIDQNYERPSWSSTGPSVELTAPGVNVYSTMVNDQYGIKSGTSMACPHVAGLAALILSSDPDITPSEVRNTMRNTANDLGATGRDEWFGSGLIDTARALPVTHGDDELPEITLTDPADGSIVSGSIRIQASASDDIGVAKVSFYRGDIFLGFDTTAPYTFAFDTRSSSQGSQTITVVAADTANQTTEVSVMVTVNNPDPINTFHVASIDISFVKVSRTYLVTTSVRIENWGASQVQGATVTIQLCFGPNGKFSEILSGVTGTDGTVTLSNTPTKWKRTYEATVTNVQVTGWTYDQIDNIETVETILVR